MLLVKSKSYELLPIILCHIPQYLQDDPFASLDVHVGRKLFHQGILGLLLENHCTVILVTHQLQYLPHAQQVMKPRPISQSSLSEHDTHVSNGSLYDPSSVSLKP